MNRISRFAVCFIDKVLKRYWKLFKPNTHGVKALILHPEDPGLCVMIRQSYGDQERWGLPGGGYRPAKESAEAAARRECREELGLDLLPTVDMLEELLTTAEGKRDHLTILRATALSADLRPNHEVAEARWTPLDYSGLPNGRKVSRFADLAIATHGQPFSDGKATDA